MTSVISKSERPSERNNFSLQASSGWQVSMRSYAWSPPTDVYETEVSFVVRLEIAGMREADFNIQESDRTLVISGTRWDSSERRAYRQMEIRYGEFNTAIDLPAGLDTQHVQANYEDGFLVIIFPKLKPTGLSIQGKP